ncbi:hypothetical protein ACFTQ7_14350 [Lysinibacillus sp. NPDC056959]
MNKKKHPLYYIWNGMMYRCYKPYLPHTLHTLRSGRLVGVSIEIKKG